MNKIVLLALISPLLVAAGAHKYYLSVTDLAYNEEASSVQMISRLFYDDLEAVLQERYDDSIVVSETENQEKLDRFIEKYLTAKLKITINNQDQKISYVGKKYEDDYVVIYSEIEGIKKVSSIEIENLLLTDLFTEQKNMVHTDISQKKKSFLLTLEKAKAVLNFSE